MKTTNTSKFRLFKRDAAGREIVSGTPGYKERPYYFKISVRGKTYVRTLETNDAATAQRRAKAKADEITASIIANDYKRLDASKTYQTRSAPIAELVAAYRTGPAEASAATRATNIHALHALLAASNLTALTATVADLTPALVRRWFETISAKVLAEPDQAAAASLKRSANSRLAQARSLFTFACCSHYVDCGLAKDTADLEAFALAIKRSGFKRIAKIIYYPPPENVITATLAAWEDLACNGQRDLFLAIGHELAFGLRAGELSQARWNWHSTLNGYHVLKGEAAVKNGSGGLLVRALDPYYTTLRTLAEIHGWWPSIASDELIIPGTTTYRTDVIFREVSAWLRSLGWQTTKTNHALRAFAGGQVAMKYHIYDAQVFLRHSSVSVTETFYKYFVDNFRSNIESPVKWAVQSIPTVNPASATADAVSDAGSDVVQTGLRLAKLLASPANVRN